MIQARHRPLRFHVFNLTRWFGHLIEKRSQNCGVFSITEPINNILYCTDVGLSIYTHTVHDTQEVNIQMGAGSRMTLPGLECRINHFSFRSTTGNQRRDTVQWYTHISVPALVGLHRHTSLQF